MNICLVTSYYFPEDGGGIATYSRNLARGLAELGHKVYIIARTSGPDSVERDGKIVVMKFKNRWIPKLEFLFPGLAWSLFLSEAISNIQKRLKFDVVEFPNWEGPGFFYLLRLNRRPVIVRVHTPYIETVMIDSGVKKLTFGDKFICWLEKKAVQWADKVTSSTMYHRDFIAGIYKMGKTKFEIIPLGIGLKTDKFGPSTSKKNEINILYVSRLEKRKGTLLLMDLVPEIVKLFPNARFGFAGKDRPHAPNGAYFKDYFKKVYASYSDKVRIYGYLSDRELAGLYGNCDIFCVPSLYESFGLIYLEAMKYAKPVVACKAGGIPEVVEDGKTGFLIQPNHPDELLSALTKLITDEGLRVDMGINGQKRAYELFGYEKMAKKTEGLYKGLLG